MAAGVVVVVGFSFLAQNKKYDGAQNNHQDNARNENIPKNIVGRRRRRRRNWWVCFEKQLCLKREIKFFWILCVFVVAAVRIEFENIEFV